MNLKYHEAFNHCKETCLKLKDEECKKCGLMTKPFHHHCVDSLKVQIEKETKKLEFMKIDELDNSIVDVETLVCTRGHSLVKVRGEPLDKKSIVVCNMGHKYCCKPLNM